MRLASARRPKQIGDARIWFSGAATATCLLLFAVLIVVVAWFGTRAFWVSDIHLFRFEGGKRLYGSITVWDPGNDRFQVYTANRDVYDHDFRWLEESAVLSREKPSRVMLLERTEKGRFIGSLESLDLDGVPVQTADETALYRRFRTELRRMKEDMVGLRQLERRLTSINRELERIRLGLRRNREDDAQREALIVRQRQQRDVFERINAEHEELRLYLSKRVARMADADGRITEIALMDIIRGIRPNDLSVFGKIGIYGSRIRELLLAMPRESNTEGGLFPAIMGTVLMVLLMSVFCVPLGVVAAVYLHEYAVEGPMVSMVRIAVNNLAGVPSIVYGMFGLGFFVYGIGGSIDRLLFAEQLPIPTYGTGGLLWCSLTMALLTVPVVIVSTEEGLSAVPRNVRDGSLALGATRFQTIIRVILPMATPGILTGLILAIARAAGEVAPLMLVGVARVAPGLPLDGEAPYLHLDRKIMHLGFHIYDVGFQSPNVEAAKPMVYVTTLLLLLIVLGMSGLAMYLRNAMKKRYALSAF